MSKEKKYIPWHKNDALFKRELRDGLKWQGYVAEEMEKKGWTTDVPVLEFRKSIRDMPKYKDVADVIARKGDIEILVEVKSRRIDFTCPEDYRWPTVFIDTKAGYDAKDIKPDLYVVVSRSTGAMICLPAESPKCWEVTTTFDRVRRIPVTNYVTDKHRWMTFDRGLKEAEGEACRRLERGITLETRESQALQRLSDDSKGLRG